MPSDPMPVIDTGRLWGTSASSAPSVTTIPTSSSVAAWRTVSVKRRQRSEGSTPSSITRSRSAPGTEAAEMEFSGQSISRVWPSLRRTVGRTAVKS